MGMLRTERGDGTLLPESHGFIELVFHSSLRLWLRWENTYGSHTVDAEDATQFHVKRILTGARQSAQILALSSLPEGIHGGRGGVGRSVTVNNGRASSLAETPSPGMSSLLVEVTKQSWGCNSCIALEVRAEDL